MRFTDVLYDNIVELEVIGRRIKTYTVLCKYFHVK